MVYYVDAGADDGISSLIATGPLYQGGQNEIYSSASQIDDLAVYLKAQIDAQDARMEQFAENLKIEIENEVEELKNQLIIENRAMISAAIAEIKEAVDASVDAIKGQIDEEIDAKIAVVDASIAFNSSVLASAIFELQEESRLGDASLRALMIDSYRELVELVNEGDAAVDSSLKNYVDPIFADIKEDVSSRDAAIRAEMNDSDAVLATAISDVSGRLASEIRTRSDEDAFNASTQKAYTDALRSDVSVALANIDTISKDYVDASVSKLRQDASAANDALQAYLEARQDASIGDVVRKSEYDISTLRQETLTHFDASYNELVEKIDHDDEIVEAYLMTKIETGDTSVYNTLKTTIDDEVAQINASILAGDAESKAFATASDASLKSEITSAYQDAVDSLRNDTSVALTALDESLTHYSDENDASLRSYINEKTEEVEVECKSYTDSSVTQLRTETSQNISTLETTINTHIDSSLTVMRQELVQIISAIDSSFGGDVSVILNKIEEVRQFAVEHDVETLAAAKEYADVSVERLRNETSSDIAEVRSDYAEDIKSAVETLDSSVEDAINSTYAQVTSEYKDADASLKSELIEKIESGDTSVFQYLDVRIDREVSTLSSEFEDRLRETESELSEAIASGDSSVCMLVLETETSLESKINELRRDASAANDELEERIMSLETSAGVYENEIAGLNDKDVSLKAEIDDLANYVDASLAYNRESLENVIQTLTENVGAAIQGLNVSIQETESGYKAADSSIREEINSLAESNDGAHAAIIDMIETLDVSASDSIAAAIATMEGYVDENIDDVKQSISDLAETHAEDVSAINADIDDIDARLQTTDSSVNILEGRMDNIDNEIAEIIGDVSSVTVSIKELSDRMDAVENDIAVLEYDHVADVSALNARIDYVASDVYAIASNLSECVDNVSSNSARISRLEFDMYDSSGEIMQDMSNIAANFVAIDSSVENLRSDVTTLDENLEMLTVYTERSVDVLDSSMAYLYDVVRLINKRLGLDKIEAPMFDILPDIMNKIQEIYDKDLEWRTLDSSGGEDEHFNYDKYWRMLHNEDAESSTTEDEPVDE